MTSSCRGGAKAPNPESRESGFSLREPRNDASVTCPTPLRPVPPQAAASPTAPPREDVAFLGGGEAALRGQRELLQRREFRGLFEAPLDVVALFQLAELGGDQPG